MMLNMAETTTLLSILNTTDDAYDDTFEVTTAGETETSNSYWYNFTHGFNEFIGKTIDDWTYQQCLQWQTPHHIYFQVANGLFLIAFLSANGSYGALCARCALVLGSIFLIMFSYLIECSLDGVVWSSAFLCINFVYLIVLIYRLRPIRFQKEIEAVSFCFFTFDKFECNLLRFFNRFICRCSNR